jgi:hypothetical protein
MTPARFERATCGLGIGPRLRSSEPQNVSGDTFTLKTEESNVSPCVRETLDPQPLLTRLLPGGRLLTLLEGANYLAVDSTLVEKLVAEKALRAIHIGPEIRVRPEDPKAFVSAAKE